MGFPEKAFDDIGGYFADYADEIARAHAGVDHDSLRRAAAMLTEIFKGAGRLYVCGNGGSAAIANHLVCDHIKLVKTDTDFTPRVVSLSNSIEMITAIANDISYDEVFKYQLSSLAEPGDVVMTISSSGDSENVVRAVQWAREHGLKSISLTGFTGGRTRTLADVNVHVSAENYGVVEDVHQSLMHVLAQYIRQLRMDMSLILERKF